MQPNKNHSGAKRSEQIHTRKLQHCFFPVRLKCTLFHRHSALRGVGRGVTEPDTQQKLGQVRGARRGRQERACGMEPCVGTKLTRPPPPQLQSDLLTHTLSSILTPLDFLSIVFITLCPHCKLHAESENESSACVLLKK